MNALNSRINDCCENVMRVSRIHLIRRGGANRSGEYFFRWLHRESSLPSANRQIVVSDARVHHPLPLVKDPRTVK